VNTIVSCTLEEVGGGVMAKYGCAYIYVYVDVESAIMVVLLVLSVLLFRHENFYSLLYK
jgi:hypothetical protein